MRKPIPVTKSRFRQPRGEPGVPVREHKDGGGYQSNQYVGLCFFAAQLRLDGGTECGAVNAFDFYAVRDGVLYCTSHDPEKPERDAQTQALLEVWYGGLVWFLRGLQEHFAPLSKEIPRGFR